MASASEGPGVSQRLWLPWRSDRPGRASPPRRDGWSRPSVGGVGHAEVALSGGGLYPSNGTFRTSRSRSGPDLAGGDLVELVAPARRHGGGSSRSLRWRSSWCRCIVRLSTVTASVIFAMPRRRQRGARVPLRQDGTRLGRDEGRRRALRRGPVSPRPERNDHRPHVRAVRRAARYLGHRQRGRARDVPVARRGAGRGPRHPSGDPSRTSKSGSAGRSRASSGRSSTPAR